jgi:hypothetical protein
MTHRQRDELNASVKEQRVGDNQDCGILPLDKGCEGRIDFAVGAGVEDIDLLSDSGRRRLRLLDSSRGGRKVRINEQGDAGSSRNQLTQ